MHRLFLLSIVILSLAAPAFAQNCANGICLNRFERRWNGYGWVYQNQVAVAPVVNKESITVVNNLIGIPVPVQYSQPIAQQGTTVYGYSSVAEAYGSVDLGLLYNQAARLTDQAQQLAGQASSDFASLVQAEGQNRAEVAKIVAQGQAARDALLAARSQTSQVNTFKSFTFKITQSSDGNFKVDKVNDQPSGPPNLNLGGSTNPSSQSGGGQQVNVRDISDVIKNRCVMCHNNEKASGNLNFLVPITDAQQRSCLEKITADDITKRMPKNNPKLSVDELAAFFDAMSPKKQ